MRTFLSQPQNKPQNGSRAYRENPDGDQNEGIVIRPNDKDMELWCDADFCGNWKIDMAHQDQTKAKSRAGYIVKYSGCPVTWASKMQMEMVLRTMEAELIAMCEG